MDHNYNETPLLTNSDYESIMEDLKPDPYTVFGSPFPLDQGVSEPYEQPMINPLVHNAQGMLPQPPPLEEFGPTEQLPAHKEPLHTTTPPETSPSLSSTGKIPSRDDYAGPLGFEINLDGATSSKKSWLYSQALSKVFIDIKKSLLVQFKVNQFMDGLFVRALPVYEQDDFVSVPVQRCPMHAVVDDPFRKAHPASEPGACYCERWCLVHHIIQSSHDHARYDYNPDSDRHSVVVPLQEPHPGNITTTVEYSFSCKTSCPQGMNRKPIIIVFTLENEECNVLGRIVLPVKICSCPKRDKEKEEKEMEEREKELMDSAKNGIMHPKPGKRRLSSHEKQEMKRLKLENIDKIDSNQEGSQIIVKRLDILEEKVDQKLNQLESKMDQKLSQLESKIDQKLNNLREDLLFAIYQMKN